MSRTARQRWFGRPGAAQDGAHARDELFVDERAHDVVVGAAREAADAVDRVAAGADHDHRDVSVPRAAGLPRPQAATELEAGGVGKDRVEQDEVGPLRLDELERGGGTVGGEDLEAVVAELLGQEGPRGLLVLDD